MEQKKRTLFYLIDGARPDVIQKLIDAGKLPNIKELIDKGTFTSATTCFPSTTGPAYLPFLTGTFPGPQNMPGIRWFDKAEFFKNRYGTHAMRSYCSPEIKWFNTDLSTDHPTLFEQFEKSYNIYSTFTRNLTEEQDLAQKGKSLLYVMAHFFHKHHVVDQKAHEFLMEGLAKDPDFLFAVFPSVDWDSHSYHPEHEQTIKAYEFADYSVGEAIAYLKKNKMWDDTFLLLMSDHGLTATKTHFDLAKYFSKQGIKALQYPLKWTIKPKCAVMISGNSFGAVHFLNTKEILYGEQVIEAASKIVWKDLINQKAVDFVCWRETKSSWLIESKKGKAKIEEIEKKHIYIPLTGDPLGLGVLDTLMTSEESLKATFDSDYPDALVQISQLFSSPRAGDLIVSAANDYDLRSTWEIPEHHGSHGSLRKEVMKVPLIHNQKNWKDNPIRTVDIYDTIMEWMGKPKPTNTYGTSIIKGAI